MAQGREVTPRLHMSSLPAKLSGAAVVISCLFSAFTIWIATANGIGLFGDSVDYVASARRISAGAGVRTLDGQGGYTPLTQFPPGYPALLAGASWVGRTDPIIVARGIHV